MGFLDNLFGVSDSNTIGTTADRAILKENLTVTLMQCGFTQMEIKEIMDVITLAEADIKIAEDSLAHVHINNSDPTRAMHAAMEDIKRYQQEMSYNIRKKIIEIMNRKKSVGRM